MKFTASYKKHGKWYLGWIEEISGVNTQGKTLKECRENLKDALSLIIEVNRDLNKKEFSKAQNIASFLVRLSEKPLLFQGTMS